MKTESELNAYYASQYYEQAGGPGDLEFRNRLCAAQNQLKREIVSFRPPPGCFLEIGCGYGAVLGAARAIGYETIGIEPGDNARLYAQEKGFTVRSESLEQCNFEDASFDVIYSWHVIEHVPDMTRFLNEVHRILKPGGLFFFGTENYRCLHNRYSRALHLLTGSLPALDTADEHTFLFTLRSVNQIFPKFGFNVLSVKAFHPRHKAEKFFAPARHGPMFKRAVHMSVLGVVYGLSVALPGLGAHLMASVMRGE